MHDDTPNVALWFYEANGERHGTLDEAQMIGLIRAGRLDRDTPVWKTGYTDWRLLEETELRAHLDARSPAPPSGRHVDNSLVWLLAFAPLLGYLLEWLLAFALDSSAIGVQRAMAESRYWYMTLGLNILLGVLDEQYLRSAGHNTRAFRGWVCLGPVYLYRRAWHLQQSLNYCVVWLLTCGLLLLRA
ncbi:DUF4339 domain-containing protein [Pseudomonas oryzae]|uniref:GYF domain-containing protein n=1 Tax=Pseudomonas oryzae TaxID=1392877 RepID=A0A1H1W4Z5_9PSED|nr:DUF4339 domain-containing protein [Pseudomonas oryzae]SDS91770.1 protein of unknown function [Pseudomonas oryzae]